MLDWAAICCLGAVVLGIMSTFAVAKMIDAIVFIVAIDCCL